MVSLRNTPPRARALASIATLAVIGHVEAAQGAPVLGPAYGTDVGSLVRVTSDDDNVALATNGTRTVALFRYSSGLRATVLNGEGFPSDDGGVRVETGVGIGNVNVVWSGTHFVAAWSEGRQLRMAALRIDNDRVVVTTTARAIGPSATGSNLDQVRLACSTANCLVYRLVVGTGGGRYATRFSLDGATQLDPMPITVPITAGPVELAASGASYLFATPGGVLRVSSAGNLLDAMPVSIGSMPLTDLRVAPLTSGWLMVGRTVNTLGATYSTRQVASDGTVSMPQFVRSELGTTTLLGLVSLAGRTYLIEGRPGNGSTTVPAMYVRAIAADGALSTTATQFFTDPAMRTLPPYVSTASVGGGALIGTSYGAYPAPGASDLDARAIAIDSAARPLGAARRISSRAAYQSAPQLAFDGRNYLAAWVDDRRDHNTVYAARFAPSGAMLDARALEPGASLATSVQRNPRIAFNGTHALIVWEQQVSGGGYDIYAARMSPAGAVVDASPIAVSRSEGDESSPAVAAMGATFFVTWVDRRNDRNGDFYVTRVGADGRVLDAGGLNFGATVGAQDRLGIGCNSTRCLVAMSPTASTGLYGLRLGSDARPLDAMPIELTRAGSSTTRPTVGDEIHVAATANTFAVRWSKVDASGTRAYLTLVDEAAARVGEYDSPFSGTLGAAFERDAWIVFAGESGQRVQRNGTLVSSGNLTLREYGGQVLRGNAADADGAGHALAAYVDGASVRIHLRAISYVAGSVGTPCAAAADCPSGFCVDGVCCNTACGGGAANDCQACSIAAGAPSDGMCAPIRADITCRSASNLCDAPERCDGMRSECPADRALSSGTPCLGGTCMASMCVASAALPGDGGTFADAGATGDASTPSDAGSVTTDAGALFDAGSTTSDAAPPRDAGSMATDDAIAPDAMGMAGPDAGALEADTGVAPPRPEAGANETSTPPAEDAALAQDTGVGPIDHDALVHDAIDPVESDGSLTADATPETDGSPTADAGRPGTRPGCACDAAPGAPSRGPGPRGLALLALGALFALRRSRRAVTR